MGTKRIVKNDREIQKFLKEKKGEDEIQLPAFSRADDGTWEYDGITYVNTLEDYKKYKQTYGELMGFIYENFNSSIAKLYKKTLNNLIFVEDKDYRQEFIDSLDVKNGKSVSLGKLLAARKNEDFESYEVNAEQNLNSIVNLVRYVQGARRYVPSEIIKFIKNEGIKDLNKAYLIPELSDKGIVTKIGKDSGNIEMNFIMVNEDVITAIKNEMNSQFGKNLDHYFEYCKKLTEMLDSNEDYNFLLHNFVQESESLFGLDPTGYLKREKVYREALAEDEIFAETDAELNSDEELNKVPELPADTGLYVDQIQMNSPFNSSAVLNDGEISILITSTRTSFKVVLDGKKLKVSQDTNQTAEAGK